MHGRAVEAHSDPGVAQAVELAEADDLGTHAGRTHLEDADRAEAQRLLSADKHRQPTVVTLWSSDCGYCKANLKLLSSLTRNNRKLRVITVAAEPENAHLWPMLSRYGLAGPHYAYGSDSPEAIAYAIDPNWGGELPRTFLFDGAGRKERISGVLTAPAIEKATGLRF